MKHFYLLLLLVFTTTIHAQDFSKEWQRVYELEKEGSYKTLKKNIDDLYSKANKAKNETEKAKAVLFKMKLENVLEEVNYQKKIDRLQQELSKSNGIYKEVYRWYYIKTLMAAYDSKQYSWSRNSLVENTTAELPVNIDLWSKDHFKNVVNEQVNLLFKQDQLLKQTKLSGIKDLVFFDEIDYNLNQSVYEFFAINFINEYSYSSSIIQPLNDELFRFDSSFHQQKIIFPPKNDDLRNELGKKAVELFQKLEAYYILTNQNKSLDKIRYLRFEKYAKDKSAEGETFQNLGKNLSTTFYKNRWYSDYANKLSKEANKTNKKDYYNRSLNAIAEVKKSADENDQLNHVQKLENSIKEKDFAVSLKKEVYEGEPVKYLIDYKNIDTLYFAYYNFSNHTVLNDSIYQLVVKNQQPIKTTSRVLPKDLMYFQTSTEVLGEQLPLGNYLLVAYSDIDDLKKFSHQHIISFKTTNVSIITKNSGGDSYTIYVLNPKTGNPYKNILVKYQNKSYTTDDAGKVIVSDTRGYNKDNIVKVFMQNETYQTNLYLDSYNAEYVNKENTKREAEINLFTDRYIYRPGQEVHFKGILYVVQKDGNNVLENKSFNVVLKDDNSDEVNKLTVKTNELGAFSGTFLLPKNIATGDFYIEVDELDEYTDKTEEEFWENLYFPMASFRYKVEEYKRPTFDFEVEEIKQNVYFDEKVTIKGKASSLAGGAIANAKVKLNINSSFYDSEKRGSITLVDSKEELFTNDQGFFEYTFTVKSDSISEKAKTNPIQTHVYYEIEVIDQAGEVHETDGQFTVANTKYRLNAYNYNVSVTNKPLSVTVNSTSHNNDFLPVTGKVKIYQTLPVNHFYKSRHWNVPELASINEKTFRELFPYETYSLNDEKVADKVLVYEGAYTTQKDKDFELDIKNWKTGRYNFEFEISDEKSGLPIKAETTFNIKNADEKLATNENFTVVNHLKSNSSQLVLETNSIYDHVTLYVEYFDRDANIKALNFNIKKGTQQIKIPLVNSTENESVSYSWFFVYNHQLYSNRGNYNIEKSKTNEDFLWNVEWQSWNDKLNPAEQYKWKLLLKNAKNNKPYQGEFLASMYDASLDLLLKNSSEYGTEWATNAHKINNYVYAYFSLPRKADIVQKNHLNTSNYYYNNSFYWNTWNYYGCTFTTHNYYNPAFQNQQSKNVGFQVEVRDAKTNKFISNAVVVNLKNSNKTITNEDGFAKVLGNKTALVGITAVGYKNLKVELKQGLTVIHLELVDELVSKISYDRFNDDIKTFNKIYKYYVERVEGFSDVLNEEQLFTQKVLNNDETLTYDVIDDSNIIKDGVLKTIKGIVKTQDGDPIPEATVMVLDTDKSTETDVEGTYQIKASAGDRIQVNYEGFTTETLYVNQASILNFVLLEDHSIIMNDVVVDTYRTGGAEKSSKGTGSGERFIVASKTVEGRPNASFIQTLQGQVPGLNISTEAQTTVNSTTIYGKNTLEDTHNNITLRKNLQETAFFFPHLKIQKDGLVEIDFTAPEALTKWKFRGLAHNKTTDFVYVESLSKTQKDVMIQPNMPRFVRETDVVVLKARVSNTTNAPLQATAVLRLFNTVTGKDLTDKIIKTDKLVLTTINGLSANTVSWSVEIPKDIEGLQYRISVKAGNFTDGEESVIPVFSNRTLITETAAIWQLGKQNKEYKLDNLLNNNSQTLKNHQFVVEISHNATWLTMQSLPYLYDFQHTCNEQIFAKYFADVLALHVLEKNPKIKDLISEWKNNPKSKLEDNEELKQLMLQETPWMKDLVSDQEKKAQLAAYFDMDRLEKEADEIIKTLGERQNPSGGFGWFSGGYENTYITQHILVTAAQLDKLGISHFNDTDVKNMVNKAHRFIDVAIQKNLNTTYKKISNYAAIDYAFVKSYYSKDFAIPADVSKQLDQNFSDLKKNWVELSLQNKAKLAIVLNRKGDTTWAKQILNQLNESAVIDETYGMYWKENSNEYYYYHNAAEVQALIIEAFKEIDNNQTTLQKLNAWLLSQKLNKDWGTTKATTSAIYALLLSNSTEMVKADKVVVSVANQTIKNNETAENQTDDLLGYQTYQWKANEITNDFGNVSIKNKSEKPVFGGIYWQYFEDFNAVKDATNEILKISRKFYIENSDKKLEEISNKTKLKLGQKVIIRLEITAEKDMEFIHIKDMRAATFEPVDVLSGYKYKNNLRYYQSTRDAATNFFIDYLNKGSYVIDYEVRLNNEGSFTSGISTIQSMYAPEHTAHTAGKTIKVE
ncbi:CarboxypepD_reg-like domain-containing protein [Paenimyroides ummariense]|uniref:CarboxypepD_reg-like domain-containing protein n=1 Tax=Paenimyroides ummariense TaxID=913024 RepID=A0A1I5DBC1_9FLAO|nr:MG2 domain-containing protein [Paenimyroides ummariense]SFN96091.1 CarboxypepD_reg-like domain-containing protein [Paenimyroides ummariense]